MGGCQPVFGTQDVKVSLPDANDQVLLCGFTIGFGPGDNLVSTPEANNLVPAENGLSQRHLPVRAFVLDDGRERNQVDCRRDRRDVDVGLNS